MPRVRRDIDVILTGDMRYPPNREAAACGAFVATPWVAEAVGMDVDTARDPASFAAAIDRLLSDETLRRERVATAHVNLQSRRQAVVRAALEELLAGAVPDREL
ncbi:MAG: hypothetical protein ACLP01_04630 [Solirubrobacteraceae bacterium]